MVEVPTKCTDWSLNVDSDGKQFWWNKTFSISVWALNLRQILFPELGRADEPEPAAVQSLTDDQVWVAFQRFQLRSVYKLCHICAGPEGAEDMRMCCYCAGMVHPTGCCHAADADQISYKSTNAGFEPHLVVCLACDDAMAENTRKITPHTDDARRAALRSLTIAPELGEKVSQRLRAVVAQAEPLSVSERAPSTAQGAAMLLEVQQASRLFFQPGVSASWLERRPSPTKGGGLGVFALCDIPRFSVVGVYPGYEDPLSGEQAKRARPAPKYSLVDLNCADYFNRVFTEFDLCFTPFINEPTPSEKSNCAWVQEKVRQEGRLSVMTVRDIKKGEELLIGYGPLYPRDYPYSYDAYAFHTVDGYDDPACFALWHWANTDEKDAEFVCYVEFNVATNSYTYWETQDEAEARSKGEAASAADTSNTVEISER